MKDRQQRVVTGILSYILEWYINGKLLPSATRFNPVHDMGLVALDISHGIDNDSGVYMVKATNSKGSATTSGSLRVISKFM